MLEILYRIYEVADEETAEKNQKKDIEFGLFSSISKARNIELLEVLSYNSCYPCKIKDINKCGYFQKDLDSRCQLCVKNRKLWLESEVEE